MIVYRCENVDKNGPYRGLIEDAFEWLQDHNNDLTNHPTPSDDYIEHLFDHPPNDNIKCGFLDLYQLQDWFKPNEREDLRKIGFKFLRLELEPDALVLKGYHQCVFDRSKAKIIEEIML